MRDARWEMDESHVERFWLLSKDTVLVTSYIYIRTSTANLRSNVKMHGGMAAHDWNDQCPVSRQQNGIARASTWPPNVDCVCRSAVLRAPNIEWAYRWQPTGFISKQCQKQICHRMLDVRDHKQNDFAPQTKTVPL